MLNIPKNVSYVLVKRYNGEEKYSVYFIPRQHIERDSRYVYKKEQVTIATSEVDAQGVALFDSILDRGLKYKCGDRFWIHIGAQTSACGNAVPVMNLRTFESGIVAIDRVCWLPKIQGHDQELWTLGEIRKLKYNGSKKFSYCHALSVNTLMGGRPRRKASKSQRRNSR